MKIDRSRVRKSTSDVPIECQQLIERLQACSRTELLEELSKINTWTFGKCELLHWALVLDVFDKILGEAGRKSLENKWALYCDTHYTSTEKKLLLWILHFTTLLIEHSFSRHLYNSLEHLLVLLESNDMSVVLGVLNLLYMFSKRSNFISRLSAEKKNCLLTRLHHLAENWGGKENGFGLADCCDAEKRIPYSATTLHVEFHRETDDNKDNSKTGKQAPNIIHIEHVDKIHKTPAEIMKSLLGIYYVPPDKQMWLFTHVRLAHHFADYNNRLLCVQARLQALSVLVYSNAIQDSPHNLLYNGLLEELVELVELKEPHLVEIRSAALRTLTAIIHLDRNPHIPKKPGSRLNNIIDVTGASQYHGFLPQLVRNCIITLTNQNGENQYTTEKSDEGDKSGGQEMEDDGNKSDSSDVTMAPQQISDGDEKFPLSLATALFSFLYHLASYEAGGEALVSCGMMESLLQVINWHGVELEHITFVTRAVRVIDLITNIDMQAFHTHGGLQSFISRLDIEVKLCQKDQLYEVKSSTNEHNFDENSAPGPSSEPPHESPTVDFEYHAENVGKTCLPQRAALLKSMLNFLKKALQDSTFADNIRHLMEGTLPNSLKNIIANAEYYGPSLFLLATDVVTVYVYQEPSLLSALQDNGLTDVVLHSLLTKEIPPTREVLGSLPNVFSALCLNARGLQTFIKCKPFEKTFSVLLSPDYLPAMRRRRSSEPMADTACNLGNAMDELMRHQPSLKSDAIKAIINLLEELVRLGTDPKYICWKPHSKSEVSPSSSSRSATNTEGSSDEEDDDEEEASTSSQNVQGEAPVQEHSERTPIALIDYILNVMKFIDAILSNNSTDDHCREFVLQGGLRPLLKILGLPNLPVNCPVTNPAQAVATVCKSILNLAHETNLFKESLSQLTDVLVTLRPMYTTLNVPGGPKLLLELASASNIENAFNSASTTPLLHAMAAAHGYIIMLVHVCRTGQSEIRNLSLQNWGSEEGLRVIKGLADLYTSLVWESTLLLAYCSEEYIPSDFTREDIEKLHAFFDKCESNNTGNDSTVTSAMEALSTNPTSMAMDVDQDSVTPNLSTSLKYIKPLLGASSRLGRALAELFGLLVKLCVGSPIRQRRGQNIIAAPPIPSHYARSVATALNVLLANGLDYERLPACPLLKSRITFLICSIGFTSPMLFDEKRYPYHLMLKKFLSLGGHATFFSTFRWAITAGHTIPMEKVFDHGNLPEAGFLDAWLMLLEKMVNPKAILESPHIISNRLSQPSSSSNNYNQLGFDPLKYLIQIHKLAFENIMLIWDKAPLASYGTRIAENVLTILRHILRGEKIIKEKLKAEENSSGELGRPKRSGNSSREPEVNPETLSQLMDMGFSREHATDAVLNTLTVEQATDYLLTNPPQLYRITQSFMNSDSLEDEQVMEAIVISLENTSNSPETMKRRQIPDDGKPLSEELIDKFTNSALDACLKLLDSNPESVHKICELLVTIMKRNGRTFRDTMLDTLVGHIFENAQTVYNSFSTNDDAMYLLTQLSACTRLHNYVHLYILFFEVSSYFEMKIPCALAIHKTKLLEILVKDVGLGIFRMKQLDIPILPKWLASVYLLIDAVSKVSTCAQRKRGMHLGTTRVWRWFHLETGKWTPYSNSNNKLINDAYWNGEQSVRVTCGRRRYTVTFSNMLQLNDESGNNRPISMTLVNAGLPACLDISVTSIPNLPVTLTEKEDKRCAAVPTMEKYLEIDLVKHSVKLMRLPIDKDLIHALLQICIRYTRDYELAREFVEAGGVKVLLNMKQIKEFGGFAILATILVRHTLEEPNTLSYAIEKIIRARTLPTIPPYYKELSYLCRQIGGAVTRSPETFYAVARNILRVDTDINLLVDNGIPVKTEPVTRTRAPPLEEQVSNQVICDLLNSLLKPIEVIDDGPAAMLNQPSTSRNTATTSKSQVTISINDIIDEIEPENQSTRPNNDANSENPSETDNKKRRMLLPKSVILKILGDAVVSYGPIARIITEFTYKARESEYLREDCTALAFMLDKILPETENISDSDCSTMCRMLIAAIASSNHSPEAQFTLVSEVKAALLRALNLPESTEKHSQVQLIAGVISIMIDNCPSSQTRLKSQPPSPQMNNIVKLMIRKQLFNDLARVPHYLDLSSPNTPFTVNACLKSLEALSRIVNQPVPANIQKSKKNQQQSDENTGTQSGPSTERPSAQREVVITDSVVIEDPENTEHDIAVVTSTIEVEANENENVLVHMIDQLLEQGNDNNQTYSDVASSRNHTMDIDESGNLTYELERDATEELMSTDSGESDSNPSDQVEDEDNDDNEGDDDNIDDNDDNNYDDEEASDRRRAFYMDRNDDVLMIQYTNPGAENEVVTRMVAYPMGDHTPFPMPLFDEINNSSDHTGPIVHPLLMSRNNLENSSNTVTRTQRATRARRYQYLFNPRNPNPPVILQRLLGPHEPQVTLATNSILGGPPEMRESTRLVVMDNFSLLPSHEEQIDFVDQSGYLFGPSLAATLNHISPVLHWWNIESKCLDYESVYDCTTEICNKLIPILIRHRNHELFNKRKDGSDMGNRPGNIDMRFGKSVEGSTELNTNDGTDEDIDGVPIESSELSDQSQRNDQSPFAGTDEDIDGVPIESSHSDQSQRNDQAPFTGYDSFSQSTPRPSCPITLRRDAVECADDGLTTESDQQEANAAEDLLRNDGTDTATSFEETINPFELGNLSPIYRPSRPTTIFPEDTSNPSETENINPEINDDSTTRDNEEVFFTTSSSRPESETPREENEDNTIRNIENNTNQDAEANSGPSNNATEEIPDGVDPSFLEALPPEMRQEVLEQHRILRLQQRIASIEREPVAGTSTEVSPEFLAALPPSLQEEVLSQQRLEQQRQAAAQSNPNEPVDAGAFFETLQPSLRTMILSDMEDSQMSALPPDLAAEAQTLRRDWEARNRQMVQERILQSNLSSIIRQSSRARLPPHHSSGHFHRAQWTHWNREFMNNTLSVKSPPLKIRGRQLLDHEGLSCLLVLLFTDDPHLGKLRLHRVIRNLCYHAPTREWIVNALLSIIDKSVNVKPDESLYKPHRKMPKPGPLFSKLITDSKLLQNNGNWLNIRMEAALGCSANVFIINKNSTGKRNDRNSANIISIHPQAAPIVCRNALDLFTSLAKAFPSCLLPIKCIRDDKDDKNNLSPVRVKTDGSSEFWEILLRLDSVNTKKGKSIHKNNSTNSTSDSDNKPITFEQSVFGQLLNMLSSPVVHKNTQLTDNLLRLLSVITSGMPELAKPNLSKSKLRPQRNEALAASKVENITPINALHLAVNVITYKNCSEEGLEFITNLLLNLASSTLEMSYMILRLLLSGAIRIGKIVKDQIQAMLKELKELNNDQKRRVAVEDIGPSTSKGTISNRFTKETVVITASTKVKASCELQLPSMVPLTSKNSSQVFFLRVLRVIVQIRNSFKQNVKKCEETWTYDLPALSDQLSSIDSLWETLSHCLLELEHTPDHHAVLVLQPAVEAFFLVHSPQQGAQKAKEPEESKNGAKSEEKESGEPNATNSRATTSSDPDNHQSDLPELRLDNSDEVHEGGSKNIPPEQQKFLSFAEKHRRVLNQILRQSTSHLADGPFAVLVDHARILDFDIKRRYFRTELERMDQGIRREETAVHVRRSHIFEDSFRELYRRSPEEWKNRFYIVFEDEEGQDAGGLLREWYVIISRDIFNPMYALFTVSPGDRVTYMINSASHYNPNHLCYYKFVGRVIAKAIYDNKLLECYFTRSFYKHILGIPVKYTDMESEDYSFYRGLVYLMENNINNLGLDLTFSTEINEFGVTETRDLVCNGRNVTVTEETKMEYIRLSCQMKMTGAIKQQLNAFLEGFYDIIPMRLISIFNEQELELLISGLPNVDIDDLKANTEYHKYQANSLQIQWFWRALRSFDQADRAKFLQFVTGTSKVPLQGFGALEGMNGVQKFQIHRDDRSTDRLPSAHTCFNQLDLPVYETYDKLRSYLLKAIHECSEGFGFA